ncbi:MAG: FAD-dependent monooxygenase [Chromatiales bacterium]|nr:FAD-dependent monooxygenase [Chromatiales bacterium]
MVGASLACALAGQDLRIGLVEAAPFAVSAHPSYDDRAIALAQGTKRIFQTLGLWETVGPAATPIRQIHISERGGIGFAHLDSRDEGVDALGYVAEARLIGAALLAKLPSLNGVELLCPARLEKLAIEPEAACATIRFGDERIVELRAGLLVAADGANSPVREQLGIAALRWEYGQQAVIANVTPTLPHNHVAYERFTEDGPVALLPMNDNRCAVVCYGERSRGTGGHGSRRRQLSRPAARALRRSTGTVAAGGPPAGLSAVPAESPRTRPRTRSRSSATPPTPCTPSPDRVSISAFAMWRCWRR